MSDQVDKTVPEQSEKSLKCTSEEGDSEHELIVGDRINHRIYNFRAHGRYQQRHHSHRTYG